MIKLHTLNNGMQILGQYKEGKIKMACQIMATQEGVGLVPLHPITKVQDIEVSEDSIAFSLEVPEELSKAYREQFISPLVLPTNQSLIT